jgi:signal transduction histidine kinase/CheY-like chemotaxis protein
VARVSAGAVLMNGHPLPDGGTGPLRIAAPRRLSDYPVISNITLDETAVLLNWRAHSRMIVLLSGFLVAIVLFATFLVASLLRGQDQTLAQLTDAHRRTETEAAAKSQLLAELRASESRLMDKSATLEVTLENIEQGLLMIGPDGIIPVCNRRAVEMLGLPDEALSGSYKFADLLAHQWKIGEFSQIDQGLEAFVRGGGIKNAPAVYERLRPNGTTLEVRSIPLKGGGVVRTFSDVTDRNRTAALLLAAKEHAETASRAKSDFLANMSHEIRTPMNGILGMNALLLDSGLNEQQFKYASMAYESGEAMLRVINDILDISKLEAGKVELEVLEFDLAELAGSVTGLLGRRAEENGVALTVTIDPALPNRFRGDPTRLRQILLNLISNGIKFTRNGSVHLIVAPAAAATRFEVVDTGSGIAAEALGRLFEKFTQADSSITRRHGGTGLGLAICRELVELMGGRIGVTSQLGLGSCFWFELPTAALAAESAAGPAENLPPASVSMPRRRALHVLVGEDNPINQQVMRAMLARAGHTMRIVGNGEDVVRAVSEGSFDIVLMDIQMPRLDGMEATRRIRDLQPPKSQIPIVAVTADAMTGARDHYVRAGMDGYLAKPLRFRELVETIDSLALEPFTAAS